MISDYENDWLFSKFNNYQQIINYEFSTETCNKIRNLHEHYTYHELFLNFKNSIQSIIESQGDKIYVALSGGSDSQATCLLLKQINVKFTAVILVFNNKLNDHDSDHAINFCKINDIPYETITVDILKFLTKELHIYIDRYRLSSPQISMHFKFFEIVYDKFRPDILICGGNTPYMIDSVLQYGPTHSQNQWTYFKQINNVNLIGNFLSWNFELALLLILHTPNYIERRTDTLYKSVDPYARPIEPYLNKIEGFSKLGLNIIPQPNKMTGFEKVKKACNKIFGIPRSFDIYFRHPHELRHPEYKGKLLIPDYINVSLINLKTSDLLINTFQ